MSRIKIHDDNGKALRHHLDEIAGNTTEELHLHRQRVENLRVENAHTIKYVDEGGGARSDCVEYALEIPGALINIAATFNAILDDFWMALPEILRKMPQSELSGGHVVLYFDDGKMKHVGRVVQGTRIVSKWGKNPVYDHDLCQVPASYGDEYEFFKQPSVRHITTEFIEFVRHHCRYIDIKDTFEEFVTEYGYGLRL